MRASSKGSPPPSWWQRFLKQKTGWQRLLLAVGAIAGALVSIAAVVTALAAFVDRAGGVDGTDREVRVVESQQRSADQFVQQLIEADGGALQLNHKIIGQKGPADVTLVYNCQPTSQCSTTRVQAPAEQPDELPNGRWFKGCWAVTMIGNGYGAGRLDFQLVPQDPVCPR